MRRLSHGTLVDLQDAAVRLRLDRDALLEGVDPRFTARIPNRRNTAAQILTDLHCSNDAGTLADGSAPLRTWLINAARIAPDAEASLVFVDCLRQAGFTSEADAEDARRGARQQRSEPRRAAGVTAYNRRRLGITLGLGGAILGLFLLAGTLLASRSTPSRCPANMVHMPGATFRMGSEDYDKDASGDERPAHEVTLSAFCIDATEVTVASYRRCTTEDRNGVRCPVLPAIKQWDPADLKFWARFCNRDGADRDDHPVSCVDWEAASTYCKWAGGALPTEAQWEYAARGVERRRFPWGDEPPGPSLLNTCGAECRSMAERVGKSLPMMYDGNDGAETTAPVGSYPEGATPRGVMDLAGNVAEWVRDTKADYESALPKDPVQTAGRLHVVRGGAWYTPTPRAVRGAARDSLTDGFYLNGVGFRCVHEEIR